MNTRTHRGIALAVGCVSLLICAAAGTRPIMREQFFNSYLFAWLFWLAVSLGAMALTMMHHLTGGGWGVLIRPITLSAARVLPLLFLLFFPIFLGMPILFPWLRPAELAADPILRHVHSYLNPQWFAIRFVIYFMVWIGLVFGLTYSKDEGLLRRISAGGLVIYVILMTLGGVDWIMSRQAHWSSSIFGFILVIAQTLTALCFTIVILWSRVALPAIARFAKPKHFIDLANMLLMFIILWAYMNFAQYLITWTGNEQPDIGWYVQRTYGGWRVVAGIIIFIHFLIPFFLLLMRPLKQDISRLGPICVALLVLRILDLYWNIGPQAQSDPHGGFILSPLDVLAWLGVGGVWYATFSHYLKKAPLLRRLAKTLDRLMEHPNPNPPESAPAGHEIRDAAPRPILVFVVSLVATLVIVHLIGWGALRFLQSRQETASRTLFPTHPLSEVMSTVPPDPRLEPEPSRDVLPQVDLAEVQAREQALIGQHAWGWVDSSRQFARIPVEQAINLAVEHGLPALLPATQPSVQPFMPPASALHGPGGVP